jgi:hypothetical protein
MCVFISRAFSVYAQLKSEGPSVRMEGPLLGSQRLQRRELNSLGLAGERIDWRTARIPSVGVCDGLPQEPAAIFPANDLGPVCRMLVVAALAPVGKNIIPA